MDFTDDPFKNYRYEDPFNIADPFDDEPSDTSTISATPAAATATTTSKSADNLDAFGFATFITNAKATLDPFASSGLGGRQSVPLPTSTSAFSLPPPNSALSGRASAPLDPFAAAKPNLPPEDQQLAWAAAESLRLEEARKKRQLQEQADLEYAIALSKQDATSSSSKS